MIRHYDRNVKVTVWRPPAGAAGFFAYTDAIEVHALRVRFDITRQLGKHPNKCDLLITNLSEESRAFFEQRPLHVKLDAGYDGEFRHLFSGDIRFGQSKVQTKQKLAWGTSKQVGTDWETRLQLGDGDRAFKHARVSRTFKPGTSVRTALEEAAKTMGLGLPDSISSSPLLEEQFTQGITLQGPTRDELTNLLAPYGYRWSIQNGQLTILADEQVTPGEALVISQDTGMIGAPEYGAPKKKGGKPKLTVQTLLYPEVNPGGLIQVQSRFIKGNFKVERVNHTGDTHGPDWTTEIEAIAV